MAFGGDGAAVVKAVADGGDREEPVRDVYKSAFTGVFWDIDRCPLPSFCRPLEIAWTIKKILSGMGYRGKVDIFAVGDTSYFDRSFYEDFRLTGVTVKDTDDDYMDVWDVITSWKNDNHPPANILFISDDNFSDVFRHLSGLGYKIIQVKQESAGFQKDSWNWSDLVDAAEPILKVRLLSAGPDIAVGEEDLSDFYAAVEANIKAVYGKSFYDAPEATVKAMSDDSSGGNERRVNEGAVKAMSEGAVKAMSGDSSVGKTKMARNGCWKKYCLLLSCGLIQQG